MTHPTSTPYPSPSVSSAQDSDQDESGRTSLFGSLDELLTHHQARTEAETAKAAEAARTAVERTEAEARATRRREVSQMYRAVLVQREKRIISREEAARVQAQKEARRLVEEGLKATRTQLRTQEEAHQRSLDMIAVHEASSKHRWAAILRAAVVLGALGLLLSGASFANAHAKTAQELSELRKEARSMEQEAQARVQELQERLSSGTRLIESERQQLIAQLRGARRLQEEALEAALEQEAAGEIKQVAARTRGSKPSKADVPSAPKGPSSNRFSGDLVGGQCAIGDPLCGTL